MLEQVLQLAVLCQRPAREQPQPLPLLRREVLRRGLRGPRGRRGYRRPLGERGGGRRGEHGGPRGQRGQGRVGRVGELVERRGVDQLGWEERKFYVLRKIEEYSNS